MAMQAVDPMRSADPNKGTTTNMVAGGRIQSRTTWPDGTEMVEEYDAKNGLLLVRKWKTKSTLGRPSEWKYEIGEAPKTSTAVAGGLMAVSSKNPIFIAQDTPKAWQWRIRNLPYPKNVYGLTIDDKSQELILRTTNKKYYKRFDCPALKRLSIPLDAKYISMEHSSNTLVISYRKPDPVLLAELEERKKLSDAKTEGDVGCKQQ